MWKRMLVAVDGSEFGFAALAQALDIAQDTGATICALYVIDARLTKLPYIVAAIPTSLTPEVGRAWAQWATQVTQGLRELGETVLEQAKALCAEHHVPCESELTEGNVSQVIIERAKSADVIVMGRQGAGARIGGPLLGSAFEAVVRHAPVPVLGVQKEARPIRRILVAYDGSERSRDALDAAAELALVGEREILLLTVETDTGEARSTLEEGSQLLAERGVSFRVLLRAGHEAEVILQVADEEQCDLIAMGAYGRRRFLEIFFGSTVEDVMRRTTLPILIAR